MRGEAIAVVLRTAIPCFCFSRARTHALEFTGDRCCAAASATGTAAAKNSNAVLLLLLLKTENAVLLRTAVLCCCFSHALSL